MSIFGTSGPSIEADKNGKPAETPAVLPPHKDAARIVTGAAKVIEHGGYRPGAGRKPGTVREAGTVAAVPKKSEFRATPELVRPFAEAPFDIVAAFVDSDAFHLEEDQAQLHAVYMAGAVNDLGVQIDHAAVYAYLALMGSTFAAMFAKYRKEKKSKPAVPGLSEAKDANQDVKSAA